MNKRENKTTDLLCFDIKKIFDMIAYRNINSQKGYGFFASIRNYTPACALSSVDCSCYFASNISRSSSFSLLATINDVTTSPKQLTTVMNISRIG